MGKVKNKTKKYKLEEIDELNLGLFIVKQEFERPIGLKIAELGGRVLSSMRAQGGYSLSTFFNVLSGAEKEYVLIVSAIRKEDAQNLVEAISVEFNFDQSGGGKAFVLDVDGYMGAKGPFLK